MIRATVISASLLALVSAAPAPLQRRTFGSSGSFGDILPVFDIGNSVFDSSSATISEFSSSHSFNLWGGISSLNGFDNFFGSNNFCGSNNIQTFSSEEVLQCQSIDVTVIQQQLAVITEFAKRIITTEICEVETQTIVLQQWISGLQSFSEDIRHVSSRTVSFDSSIASHISDLCDSEGNIITSNLGFSGTDIGSNSVHISGFNWNDQTSPSLVSSAFSDCESAAGFSLSPTCPSSDCGSSSIIVPPTSSSCSGSDCGSSISIPPSSDCSGSDCGSSISLPPTSSDCSGSDCGSSVSIPPSSSDCDSACMASLDSASGIDTAGLPVATDGSSIPTDVATDSAGDAAAPTDSAGDAAAPTDSAGDAAAPTDSAGDAAAPTDSADAAAPTDDSTDAAAPTDIAAAPTDASDAAAPTDTSA